MRAHGQEVRVVTDDRHLVAAEELDRHEALPLAEVELNRLQEPREVGDAQDFLGFVLADVSQHFPVLRTQQFERASAERAVPLAQRDEPLGPRIDGVRVALLCLDVDRFVVVLRICDHGQVEALAVRT